MSSKSEQLVRDTLDILEDEKYKCKVAFSDILESQFHESDSAFFSFLFKTKKQLHDFLIPGEVNRVFRKLQKWIKTMRKAEHASLYAHFRKCQPVHGWVPSKKSNQKVKERDHRVKYKNLKGKPVKVRKVQSMK